MRVDLTKLGLIVAGSKVTGLADSADLTLPAEIPEGVLVSCKHLSLDNKDLMSVGSVWNAQDYFIKFILCQKCVIAAQHFSDEMQTQARICPICIDDHSENRPCKNADLIERILYFTKKTEILTRQRNRELQYNLNTIRHGHLLERAIEKLDEELNEGMKR